MGTELNNSGDMQSSLLMPDQYRYKEVLVSADPSGMKA